MAVGEFINQSVIDPVGLHIYANSSPTIKSGNNNGAKHRKYKTTMRLHRTLWAYDNPEPYFLGPDGLYHNLTGISAEIFTYKFSQKNTAHLSGVFFNTKSKSIVIIILNRLCGTSRCFKCLSINRHFTQIATGRRY